MIGRCLKEDYWSVSQRVETVVKITGRYAEVPSSSAVETRRYILLEINDTDFSNGMMMNLETYGANTALP